MKLSDFRGEEAIEVLAEIIEPLALICADPEIAALNQKEGGTPMLAYVKPMLKNHSKEVIEILAILNKQPTEEYKAGLTLATLPLQVLELINDPEIQNLFYSQSQSPIDTSAISGSVTENTEAEEN